MSARRKILRAFFVVGLIVPSPGRAEGLNFKGFTFADPNFANALEILAEARFPDISSQCNGRLTLSSQTPINQSDVYSVSTLYYAPYSGSKTALYNGSRWVLFNHGEISLAITATAGKNYDVFLYSNAGTPTLELSAAWTNDTTRADALTLVNGVRVKSVNNTRRYLGTIRADSLNSVTDSLHQRFVWNECNQLQRAIKVYKPGFDNSYDTNFNYFNADPDYSAQMVIGISSAYQARGTVCLTGNGVGAVSMGIGVDSSTTPSVKYERSDGVFACGYAALGGTFTQGYHYLSLGVSTGLTGSSYFITPNMDGWIFD